MVTAGDLAEAREEATCALAIPEIGAVAKARALSALGFASVSMSGQPAGIDYQLRSLRLLAQAGALETSLHWGALNNLAISYLTVRAPEATKTFSEAARIRSRVAASNPAWATEMEMVEALNALLAESDKLGHDVKVERLSALARRCATAGVARIEGMARMQVASILAKTEQYTASLFFSTRAEEAFQQAGFDAQAFGARVGRAFVMQGLGMSVENELRLVLNYSGSRTSLQLQRLAAHSVYAEHLAFAGESAGAVDQYRAALDLVDRLRTRGVIVPSLQERAGALMGGLYRSRLAGLDTVYWVQALRTLKADVSRLPYGQEYIGIVDLLAPMASMDQAEVAALLPMIDAAAESADSTAMAASVRGLRDLAIAFTRPPCIETDLEEFHDHVRHLVGEQEETVRVAYRNANIIPVLNRILWTRGKSLTPWSQFRLIEYSRWGSLPPPGPSGVALDSAPSVLSKSAAAMRAEGIEFATSMHGEGPHAAVHTAALTLDVDDYLDIAGSAITGCDWVAQMYLSGVRLAWAGVEVSTGRVLAGRRDLNDSTVRTIRQASYWMAPNAGQSEAAFLATLGLDPAYATTLAAARVASGPFVQDRGLARDYLSGLPRRYRQQARDWLGDLDTPEFSDLCEALGQLFTDMPEVLAGHESPLALSLAGQFRGVPIALAQVSGEPLGCRRPLVTLPPLSVLGYAKAERGLPSTSNQQLDPAGGLNGGKVNEQCGEMPLTRLGNVGTASGFAPRSDTNQVVQSLTASGPGRRAVLYSGHISRGGSAGASSVGIPLAAGEHLTAADLLRADRISVPERVGIVGCEGAGWNLSDEWGGLAAALLLRGSKEVVASDWTILDTPSTPPFDNAVAMALRDDAPLEVSVQQMMQRGFGAWSSDRGAVPPQLWASLRVMRR